MLTTKPITATCHEVLFNEKKVGTVRVVTIITQPTVYMAENVFMARDLEGKEKQFGVFQDACEWLIVHRSEYEDGVTRFSLLEVD